MTKVICDLTGCKYNSACCMCCADEEQSYCTKDKIALRIDEEISGQECAMFSEVFDKEIECNNCQIKKYGGIKLAKRVTFEEEISDF